MMPARFNAPQRHRRQRMPLVHISMRAGKPVAYRQAVIDSFYCAMREALGVAADMLGEVGAGFPQPRAPVRTRQPVPRRPDDVPLLHRDAPERRQ